MRGEVVSGATEEVEMTHDFPGWSLKFEWGGDNDVEPMAILHRDIVFAFLKENLEELNTRFIAEAKKQKLGIFAESIGSAQAPSLRSGL